jgi:hypothetical protein
VEHIPRLVLVLLGDADKEANAAFWNQFRIAVYFPIHTYQRCQIAGASGERIEHIVANLQVGFEHQSLKLWNAEWLFACEYLIFQM